MPAISPYATSIHINAITIFLTDNPFIVLPILIKYTTTNYGKFLFQFFDSTYHFYKFPFQIYSSLIEFFVNAEVAELVDALDSKSSLAHTRCRFESGLRYNRPIPSNQDGFFILRNCSIRTVCRVARGRQSVGLKKLGTSSGS